MEFKQKWANWRLLGNVGVGLMANPVALIGPAFILSAISIWKFGIPYQSVVGLGWFLLAWFLLSIVGAVIVAMATSPLWGAYYLRRIEADFGPKTRARVLEWFSSDAELAADTLSIERLAWECGECAAKGGQQVTQHIKGKQ